MYLRGDRGNLGSVIDYAETPTINNEVDSIPENSPRLEPAGEVSSIHVRRSTSKNTLYLDNYFDSKFRYFFNPAIIVEK